MRAVPEESGVSLSFLFVYEENRVRSLNLERVAFGPDLSLLWGWRGGDVVLCVI